MAANPGRFFPWSSDQQINPGWLGPCFCQAYSKCWVKEFTQPTDVHYSHFLMKASDTLDANTAAKMECALLLPSTQMPKVDPLPLPAAVPSFGEPKGRNRLFSILRAFAAWKPLVGYQPDLARLAGHIMSVTGNERATFQALVTVYQRYHLQDYFEGTGAKEALGGDAAKIWAGARLNFPDLAYAFTRFNEAALFESTVSSLLSRLLTQTFCPDIQPFHYHVRLLHFFLLPAWDYDPEDPRGQLRKLVLCIMARYEKPFLQCRSPAELRTMAASIEQFVRVDDALIEMMSNKYWTLELPRGPVWPAAFMAGLGAVLAYDLASPLGLGAHVACTACGSAAGILYGALQSAQWSAEACVLTNRALSPYGDGSHFLENKGCCKEIQDAGCPVAEPSKN
ncbi:unnamed protein product [Symbiodinium natans]|uniref:Rab-GAP TBC domain-containing protein n=1 Tax=Symbiodinium natans TaxID=878477 RepID=A0A812T416_9DINO|nr:unnamed protein product [Symbiodinium natans]